MLGEFFATLRQRFTELPNRRRGRDARYRIADIAKAGFAAFFVKAPLFLARRRMLEKTSRRSN
ncbi:MAG: hypothetical protein OXI87_13280 [Albidovulum sp.]|nr:hypothetical protein [Albidovulum sp.]